MDKEVKLIAEPQELMKWMSNNEVFLDISLEEIQILLNYLEGHDFAVGTDKEGMLYRVDISSDDGERIPYTMDELIDLVCEWNYELILDADEHRNNPKDMLDFSREQNRYESYKKDEEILDRLFEQTKYGEEINRVAEKIVEKFKETMQFSMTEAVEVVAESVRAYQAERVR